MAPLTSTIRGVRSDVVVGPGAGLKQPCAINLHHVATVPTAGLRVYMVYMGRVADEVMEQVRDALLYAAVSGKWPRCRRSFRLALDRQGWHDGCDHAKKERDCCERGGFWPR